MKTASTTTAYLLRRVLPVGAALLCAGCLVAGCDDDSKPANESTIDLSKLQFDLSGVVSGINDTHCQGGDAGVKRQTVNFPGCGLGEGGSVATKAGTDGGAAGDDTAAVLYNNIGYDDDCKYAVTWEASKIAQKKDVYFQVTASLLTNGHALSGAAPYVEGFLDPTHPALDGSQKPTSVEVTPGTYVMGPYQFDAAGIWTARFHFFANCSDAVDSPHGHAAFFVAVPATASAGDQ